MIELEQIKKTDPIKSLRGQLNTAFSEIQSDQPFIGRCLNPTINLYYGSNLVGAVTASGMTECFLSALVFPENNGCFVADIIGRGRWLSGDDGLPSVTFNKLVIDIPSIQLSNGTKYTSFVTPDHLALNYIADGTKQQMPIGCSTMMRMGSKANAVVNTCAIETDSATPTTLNVVIELPTSFVSDSDALTQLYVSF